MKLSGAVAQALSHPFCPGLHSRKHRQEQHRPHVCALASLGLLPTLASCLKSRTSVTCASSPAADAATHTALVALAACKGPLGSPSPSPPCIEQCNSTSSCFQSG